MKRRTFLQTPILAAPLSSVFQSQKKDRPKKAIIVKAGEDRFGEHSFKKGASTIDCKVSAKDTEGDLCVFDVVRTQKGGPQLHVHPNQDEWFYIIEGEYLIKVGDESFRVKAGDSLFAPRKIPHVFAKVSDGVGKIILVYQPAGLMEDYFRQISKFTNPPSEEEMRQLLKSCDMEMLGPPLPVD